MRTVANDTTETLIGSMVAVGLMKIERSAFDEAVRRNLIRSGEYSPIDIVTLERMKATLWATIGFADFAAPDVVRRVFLEPGSTWPAGSCAALAEASPHLVSNGELVAKRFPFEADMTDGVRALQQVLELSRSHCRLGFYRQILERRREYADLMSRPQNLSMASDWSAIEENLRYSYGRHIPYYRQTIGLELQTILRADFTSLIEKTSKF